MNNRPQTSANYPGITAATAQIAENLVQAKNKNTRPYRTDGDISG